MKVLFLNRRDIANPAGGGAELYTHEIAAGLAGKYGCEVVVFSCRFREGAAEALIDRVKYVRRGNEATVHFWGLMYALRNRKKFDIIIDEFNGIGFFTFFLPNSILLIHQLYKEFWFRELGPAGVLPYLLEPLFLKLYRKRLAITVSESTKEDLRVRGFAKISIVMNAIRRPAGVPAQKDIIIGGGRGKDAEPTMVFLGRLKRTKQPGDAIEIFRLVKKRLPSAKLWMIGSGPLDADLRKQAKGLDGITFWGYVSGEEKMALLARAHVLVVPSVREGFGINVIEAAAAGCPAVGYNVPGLRDSIRHNKTGYLADTANDAAMRIIELFSDQAALDRMSHNCLDYAKEFDWRKRVDEFREILKCEKE